MSQATLTRIWSVAGPALVYFCLNAWSITQQWQLSLPGNPFREGKFTPHGVTLIAIPVAGVLLTATSFLTRLYALRSASANWAARIPKFCNLSFNVSSSEGRLAQGLSLCVFLLVPFAAQIHFWVKFIAGTAYRSQVPIWSGLDHLTRFVSLREALSGGYVYDHLGEIAPTFIPFWEPWLFTLIEFLAAGFVAAALQAVFANGKRPSGPARAKPAPAASHAGQNRTRTQ